MHEQTRKYLDNEYHLNEVDYRESLPPELMAECLEAKSGQPIVDRIVDADCSSFNHIFDEIREKMIAEGLKEIFDIDEGDIIDWIYNHDRSNPVKDLCKQSEYTARIVQHSNYECWIPPYDAGCISYDGVFKETVDMLGLNPKQVKKELLKWTECCGRWPDRPKRKALVKVEDFSKCCLNNGCYGVWGFFGSIKGRMIYDNDFRTYDRDIIPAGTTCGWMNNWNGGGTLELIETTRDTSLGELRKNLGRTDAYKDVVFELDEKGACSGYSIMPEVYGVRMDEPIFKQ